MKPSTTTDALKAKGYHFDGAAWSKAPKPEVPTSKKNDQAESELHAWIIRLCEERGWYYVHSRTDKRTTQAKGVPDFIIALPGGKTLWVECKTKTDPSLEQVYALRDLLALGHKATMVRTIEEFRSWLFLNADGI